MNLSRPKFVILAVLDGWGMTGETPGNAIAQANTPKMDGYWASFPHTQLRASGDAVGLPRGEVGNTETGHLNLGAGRIVYQDLARINMAIADGSFFTNSTLLAAVEHVKKHGSRLHLMGLVGAGGVHSNIEHLTALIQLAAKAQVGKLFIHAFTDGRDSPPNASLTYISQVKSEIAKNGIGEIASVMGRYWAMDRDLRWDRTARAYAALTKGEGKTALSPEEAISASYTEGKTDEFIEPTLMTNNEGGAVGLVEANDAVVFFNFRIDRPRQLTRAFVVQDFDGEATGQGFDPYAVKYEKKHNPERVSDARVFTRGERVENLFFVTMTEYSKPLVEAGTQVAFPPEQIRMPLGRVISSHNLKQLRVAESEKERFVTFYFNGQLETALPGEDRIIIASPKVATYDLAPEMSARDITSALMDRLKQQDVYSFVLINYANTDMVGHTGNLPAAVKAIETVDECVGKLAGFCLAYGGALVITADHGNAEEMLSPNGEANTEHSANPVPLIVIYKDFLGKAQTLPSGILADVAPTVLALLKIQTSGSMTGRNLLESMTRGH